MSKLKGSYFIAGALGFILASAALSVGASAQAQKARTAQKAAETYTRPAPTQPIKPTIPDANRYQEDKVFLEYADSLFRPQGEYEEFQVVKGAVKFRHGGMWMFCDSAYYYPQRNSMEAFGHVEMRQGDTLFVYADHLDYDGLSKHATLSKGPSRSNVELRNRTVTLTTDSLDYDLNMEKGWYSTGGRLQDDVNYLTSLYGEYSPSTKDARFVTDVVLVNTRDSYRLIGQELDYNTFTHVARINTPTRIEGENDTIITTRGTYNTQTNHAELLSRSTVMHTDSLRRVTVLEGDSIIHDRRLHLSRAYMFADPSKHRAPMVLTDTARKVQLIGGYGEFNDSTRIARAFDYPLLIEYSRPDSIFLRADTILSWVESVETPDTVATGKEKENHMARAIGMARFFNKDIQGIADTLLINGRDSMLFMLRKPIVWAGDRQIYGNRINVHFNDSVPDRVELPEWGLAAEHVAENFFNQLQGVRMTAWLKDQRLDRLEIDGNVVTVMLPQENDSSYNKLVRAESSYLTLEMDTLHKEGRVEQRVKHMRMWPEVSGTVTPIFALKGAEQYLDGFQWWSSLRPERQWYGDKVRWIDFLGDVPDDLETYFSQPPLFKPLPQAPVLPAVTPRPAPQPAADPTKESEVEGE